MIVRMGKMICQHGEWRGLPEEFILKDFMKETFALLLIYSNSYTNKSFQSFNFNIIQETGKFIDMQY